MLEGVEQANGSISSDTIPMPAFSDEVRVGDVIVRVEAEEGTFPEGVHLEASYLNTDAENEAAVQAADEALGSDQQIVTSLVLDVRVVDAEGNEVQPAEGKEVKVSFTNALVANENLNSDVFHIDDEGEAEQLNSTENGDTISAATTGFSTYVVVFSIDGDSATYQIPDNQERSVADILKFVGIPSSSYNSISNVEVDVDWLSISDGPDYTVTASGSTSGSGAQGQMTVTVMTNDPVDPSQNYYVRLQRNAAPMIDDAEITLEYDEVQTDGTPKKPAVKKVKLNGAVLEAGKDYEVPENAYTNNVNPGTATVTINGIGYYGGSAEATFTILDDPLVDLTNAEIDAPSVEYSGNLVQSEITVTIEDQTVPSTAYDAVFSNNKDVTDEATVTITGKESQGYKGSKTAKFSITPKPVTVTANDTSKVFGADDPTEFDATVDGLIGSDQVNYTVSRAGGEEIGTYEITPSGEELQGNYQVSYVDGTFTIKPAGEINAVTVPESSYVYTGEDIKPELTVTLKGTDGQTLDAANYDATFESNKAVGTATVTVVAKNGYIGQASTTFNITPLPIIVKADDAEKVYGETDPTLTAQVLNADTQEPFDVPAGDTLNYTVSRAQGEDVNTYAITATGGTKQGNYSVSYENATFTIKAKEIKVSGITAEDKIYDGNTDATLTYDGVTFSPELKSGDELTVSATGAFEGASVTLRDNVPAKQTVTISELKLEGAKAGNYVLAADGNQTETKATILPRAAKVTADDATKVYGDADPTEFTYQYEEESGDRGFIGEDANKPAYQFELEREKASVPEGRPVGDYAISFKGHAATQIVQNYEIEFVPGTLTITPKDITVTADDNSKPYSGDPTTDPELTASYDELPYGDNIDENLDVTRAAGEEIGDYEITVSEKTENANYNITFEPGTFTITAADSIANAEFTFAEEGYQYTGSQIKPDDFEVKVGDEVLEEGVDFEIVGYGTNKDVRDGGTITIKGLGAYAGDDETATGEFKITPKPVTVIPEDDTKVYGEPNPERYLANVEGEEAGTPGLADGDSIAYTVKREDGEDVGIYKIIADGVENQGNYTVTFDTGIFEITAKKVTVSGITAEDKVYDSTTDATLTYDDVIIDGKKSGDDLTVSGTGTFEDKNAAEGKTVNITGLVLEGAAAKNYELAEEGQQATTTATITQAPIEISGITAEKVYDATDEAPASSFDLTAAYLSGLYQGDDLTLESASGTFEDAKAGEDKVVTVTDTTLGGADKDNYYVEPVEGGFEATGTITPANILVKDNTVKVVAKEYDESADAELETNEEGHIVAELDTVLGEDEVWVESASAKFYGTSGEEDANAATGKTVYVTDVVLGGADADNYTMTYIDREPADVVITKGDINPKPLTVTAEPKDKIYDKDETTDPELTAVVTDAEGNEYASDIVDYTLVREEGQDVNEYKITFDNPQATSPDGNYSITYVTEVEEEDEGGTPQMVPVVFTIHPRLTIVTANDDFKTYGEDDPEFTCEYMSADAETKTGFLEEDLSDAQYQFTLDRVMSADEQGRNVGEYPIFFVDYVDETDPSKIVAEFVGNYAVIFRTGTFTINTKEITVTANDGEKNYGEADPETFGDCTMSEGVTFDPEDALCYDDTIDYTIKRVVGEEAQDYTLYFASPQEYQSGHAESDAPNYHITFVTGTFTINRLDVVVTADDLEKVYGEDDPELTATVEGTIKGETVTFEVTREEGEDVGTYVITPAGDEIQGSYNVRYETGEFTITPATLTIAADDCTKIFGDDDPEFTATLTGLAFDDEIEYELTRDDAGTEAGEKIGDHTITVTLVSDDNENYEIELIDGTLTILEPPTLEFQGSAHVADLGWLKTAGDGEWFGTTGQCRRLEAFTAKIDDAPYEGGIKYSAHVRDKGWLDTVKDGEIAGTWGEARRAECIKIELYGELAQRYDVYYRVHAQNYGWMNWAMNGQMAGTTGHAYRAEAIQVVLVRKDAGKPNDNYKGVPLTCGQAYIG